MEELGELELKERLLSDFRKKFGIEQGEKLRTAIEFAGRVHCNQRRDAGDPFVTHPLTVASYLLKMGMDSLRMQENSIGIARQMCTCAFPRRC